MSPNLRRVLSALFTSLALASCSGGGGSPTAPIAQNIAIPDVQTSTSATTTLSLARSATPASATVDGQKVTLSLQSSGSPTASLSMSVVGRPVMKTQSSSGGAGSSTSCTGYVPPSIDVTNTSTKPIVISYRDFQFAYFLIDLTACSVTGQGFNVALAELTPASALPVTVGDVQGLTLRGGHFGIGGFVPRANATYTFAPKSTSQISFVPAEVNPATGYPYTNSTVTTLPPGQSTTVGSVPTASCATATAPSPGCPQGSATQTSVAIDPQATSGGSVSVSCFPTTDPRYTPIAASGVAAGFPGVVKGACEFDTGASSVTLSTTVTFTITNPDPDIAHGFLEGPPVQVPCTQATSGNTITATCPTTGPAGQGFTLGPNTQTQYKYFLFGNDPYPPASNLALSPSYVSVVAGTASSGYTFVLPAFATYPVTLKIDGDVNGNLSLADSNPIPCSANVPADMTQVAPGTLTVNCNTGHQQGINVTYNGGTWQYQHNGVPGQNQDCDASCVAYAAIDLYDAAGQTLLQGDGPGATINGVSTALATIDPLAVVDPVSGSLEDANAQTINLPAADADPTGNTATVLKVTEANINALDNASIVFGLRQPTNGAEFGLNVYFGGSSFVTSGSPSLPVGSANGYAHIPYGVGLNIAANALGGAGQLFISPPEPPGQHAPPSGIITVNIPQATATPIPGSSPAPVATATPTPTPTPPSSPPPIQAHPVVRHH
jgi:hypothetical protein